MVNIDNNPKDKHEVKAVQRALLAQFCVYIIAALSVVAFYEMELLLPGVLADKATVQYVMLIVMELVTIVFIPLSLKMFSVRKIKSNLVSKGTPVLLRLGSLRLAMLGVPIVANTLFFYLTMAVAFGYLAILGALCLAFVFPSMSRCMNEIDPEE